MNLTSYKGMNMEKNILRRDENRKLNSIEYSEGKIILESYPKVIFVELTQNCNLRCLMCRSPTDQNNKHRDMDDEIFSQIKKEIFPYVSVVDLRGFGESTILNNFEERVLETHAAGPKIRLVTNGVSIKRTTWNVLMETGASVIVSIDTTKDVLAKKIGRGDINSLLRSLEIGCSERDKSSTQSNISINTVVSSLNLDEIEDVVLLAAKYNIQLITLFPVVATRDNPLHLAKRINDIEQCLTKAADSAIKHNVELRLGASLDDSQTVASCLINKCPHPWEYCYVDYLGNIGYCDHLIGHSSLTVGSLKNETFIHIWNSPKLLEIRNIHKYATNGSVGELSSLLPHCAWCYRRRYVDFEHEFNNELQRRIVSTKSNNPILPNKASNTPTTDFLRARDLPKIK